MALPASAVMARCQCYRIAAQSEDSPAISGTRSTTRLAAIPLTIPIPRRLTKRPLRMQEETARWRSHPLEPPEVVENAVSAPISLKVADATSPKGKVA